MRIEDINGYTWFFNKYCIKYIEEIDSENPHSIKLIIVFREEAGNEEVEIEICKGDLDLFDGRLG